MTLSRFIKTILVILVASMLTGQVAYCQPPTESNKAKKSGGSKLESYRSSRSANQGILLRQAKVEMDKAPESALDKVQEALAMSIAQDDTFNEGWSYQLLGDINAAINEWKLAAQNYERAYTILKPEFSNRDEFISSLTGLAKANLESGNYEASIKNYNELLSLNIAAGQQRNAELGLSEAYYRMGNYDESLKVAESIPAGKSGRGVERQQQSQLAKIYAKKNDLEKTQDLLDNTLANSPSPVSSEKPSDDVEADKAIQSSKEEVAGVLRDQKNYEAEISLRNQAIVYNTENNNLGEVSKDKVEISRSLEAKGDRSAALKEVIEAAAIADSLQDPDDKANAYLFLATLYEKNGQNNNALGAYRKYSDAVQASTELRQAKTEERNRIIQKQDDIARFSNELYVDRIEDSSQKAIIEQQRIVIGSLSALVLIIGITSIFIYRSAQSSKKANQLLALKSLRGQMNPHFIFNALNSVNHFIAQQDERTANRFLSEFSQLMRLVLENSQEDFISLQKELEIITLYLKLEHYRFRDKFEYEIVVDESINQETYRLPPMLIQPYIENAVWHGLRYRDSKGFLRLEIKMTNSDLEIAITDNGIGRKKSADLKTENQKKHKSTGLKNIQERLAIINKVYGMYYEVDVSDGPNGEGTEVSIVLKD